jgi:hypothetical protein
MYLAEKIDRRLLELESKWTGRMRKSTIVRQLQEAVKPFGAIVLWEKSAKIKAHDYWIKAFFYWNRRNQPVEVIWEFSAKSPYFDWNKVNVRHTLFLLSQALQHELIHKSQFAPRDSDHYKFDFYLPINHRKTGAAKEHLEYLSMFDEMDTFGHDIAMEIKYHYPRHDPYEVLRTIEKRKLLTSWGYYKKAFKGLKWKAVHDRVLKNAHKWLPYVTVMEKK